jgi:hypothetical protein
MVFDFAKYIFMVALCLPILWLGLFLFDKLLIEVLDIQKKKRAVQDRRLSERRKKEQFEIEYIRRHDGGYYN